jgi:hypothetical protein
LVPLALKVLEKDPGAKGDLYPGDLLNAFKHVPQEYWEQHPDEQAQFKTIVKEADQEV